MTSQVSLAFIGFGEAGLAIAKTLSASGLATGMRAHDIKLTDHDHEIAAAMRARIEGAGVTACDTARDAVEEADIVICVVTADQAAHAASLAAPHLLSLIHI